MLGIYAVYIIFVCFVREAPSHGDNLQINE